MVKSESETSADELHEVRCCDHFPTEHHSPTTVEKENTRRTRTEERKKYG